MFFRAEHVKKKSPEKKKIRPVQGKKNKSKTPNGKKLSMSPMRRSKSDKRVQLESRYFFKF